MPKTRTTTIDDLWRKFPKTAPQFEWRFATEDDYIADWIEVRWGGVSACAEASAHAFGSSAHQAIFGRAHRRRRRPAS